MEFADAFEAPIIEKIGGKDVTFPLLEIEDYLPWLAELTAARKKMAREKMASPGSRVANAFRQQTDPTVRWQMEQQIELIDVGLPAVADLVWTVPGAMRVLNMSLAKAGVPEEQRKLVIKKVKPHRLHVLAVEVSALFELKKPDPQANGGNSDPNPSSPEPQKETGEEISSLSGS